MPRRMASRFVIPPESERRLLSGRSGGVRVGGWGGGGGRFDVGGAMTFKLQGRDATDGPPLAQSIDAGARLS